MRTYSTSEIAEIMGIHPNTVMLYEKWGYIAPVQRKENGYRVYTETHLEQMKLVRMALISGWIKYYMRFEVINIIRSAAKGDLVKALEAAKLLGVSINVVVNWERYGLLEVPRSKNGYRVYGKDEIKLLRVIKALRQENYRTQCIYKVLEKLKTKCKENAMLLSEDTEGSDDWLLSLMPEAERDAKELTCYIEELISKSHKA